MGLTIAALILAAALEVGGDYLIRIGLERRGWAAMVSGAAVLAAYGFAVNWHWRGNFSTLLGVYVAVFLVVSQTWGWFVDGDAITPLRWVGIVLIVAGGFVVQYSSEP
jgi:small multidrug resistance family-3 protein